MSFSLCLPRISISGENAIEDLVANHLSHMTGKAMILVDPAIKKFGHLDRLTKCLTQYKITYSVFTDIVPNPTTAIVSKAYHFYKENNANYLIAFGGGSCIDTAKAVKILTANPEPITAYTGVGHVKKLGVPLFAINTTAGTAAEVTSNAVITDLETAVKCVIIDANIIPDIAVNDPSVMLGIPADVTAATGMDALTHAIEAYVSVGAHTVTDHSALASIQVISQWLPKAVTHGDDIKAREMMAHGQFLAGMAFNSAGLGMVHAMAHPGGAKKNLPHGVCNAILLPIICEFNRPHRVAKFANVASAMGVDTSKMSEEQASIAAIAAINALSKLVKIPAGFGQLGVTRDDLLSWIKDAMNDPCAGGNPVQLTASDVEALYMKAL